MLPAAIHPPSLLLRNAGCLFQCRRVLHCLASCPLPSLMWVPSPSLPPLAAGRLLLQRLRKSQSTTVLYGEPENALEQLQLHDGGNSFFPQLDGGGTQVRCTAPPAASPSASTAGQLAALASRSLTACWLEPRVGSCRKQQRLPACTHYAARFSSTATRRRRACGPPAMSSSPLPSSLPLPASFPPHLAPPLPPPPTTTHCRSA